MASGIRYLSEQYSKIRSRANAAWAYSPAGAGASDSTEPPDRTGTSGYTFPVDNATMRALGNRRATCAGISALLAHVKAGLADVPNFSPTRYSKFCASGKTPNASG